MKRITSTHQENGVIINIKAYSTNPLADSHIETLTEVVQNIQNGSLYVVADNKTGSMVPIHLINDKYISSNPNQTKCDNLDNLPRF